MTQKPYDPYDWFDPDETFTCESCLKRFDLVALDRESREAGFFVCEDCSLDFFEDLIKPQDNESTYHVRNGSVVG